MAGGYVNLVQSIGLGQELLHVFEGEPLFARLQHVQFLIVERHEVVHDGFIDEFLEVFDFGLLEDPFQEVSARYFVSVGTQSAVEHALPDQSEFVVIHVELCVVLDGACYNFLGLGIQGLAGGDSLDLRVTLGGFE